MIALLSLQRTGITSANRYSCWGFTLILCFNYNAIFALYWVASNVIAIVQTKGINMFCQ